MYTAIVKRSKLVIQDTGYHTNIDSMFLIRRRKFALVLVMAFMLSAIVMTSFYTGSVDFTIINGEPVWISPLPVDVSHGRDPQLQSQVVDEASFPSIHTRLEHRQKVLKDRCEVSKNIKEPAYHFLYAKEPSRHFMISRKKHLMYCFLPKVANTNFRRVFLGLEGVVPEEKVPTVDGYDVYFTLGKHFKYLQTFKHEEQTNMLQNYKKFIVVREPLERLLSAYRNKFFHPNQDHRNEYHGRVAQYYKNHKMLKKMHNMDTNFTTRSITFKEFLIYWSDTFETKDYINEHFTPTSELCSPCNYHFDYILRYENLDEEAKYMFEELDLGIPFPTRNDNYSVVATNTLVDDFYKPVDGWILKKVWALLQWDFQYFEYRLPNWYLNKIS